MSAIDQVFQYPALYMVLWDRDNQDNDFCSESGVGRHHVGLVYIPGPPPNKGGSDATYLHITYQKTKEDPNKKVWKFEYPDDKRRRSNKMVAACYLGQVANGVTKEHLKQKLQGIVLKQNQTSYRCRHWTFDAIALLNQSRYIQTQSKTAEQLWQVLLQELGKKENANKFVTTNWKGELLKKSGMFRD